MSVNENEKVVSLPKARSYRRSRWESVCLRMRVLYTAGMDARAALALFGGRITTLDPQVPTAEAMLALDGRVAVVGSNDEVRTAAAAVAKVAHVTEVDAAGRYVLPGFHDSHIHLSDYGLNLERVELGGAGSLQEVLGRIGQASRQVEASEWVLGWGWYHSEWEVPACPTAADLDTVVPNVPVALQRKDGHVIWANSAALAVAGITHETPDPAGGRIGRDASGAPNGLLFETAQDLIFRVAPEPGMAQLQRAIRRATQALHRLGVTGVCAIEDAEAFRALQALDAAGDRRLRTTVLLRFDQLDGALAAGLRSGFGSDHLRLGPIKIFSDGSLGSETAAMLEPFEGSDNRGILTITEKELRDGIERAARGGLACAVHAIGDRANRLVLDAFEATHPVWADRGLRQRIEHVQVLHPDDLPRFACLGIIASVQPIHATQDMELVDRLWGQRGRYAYAFRSLLDSGAALAFGSDAPVETPNPLAGMFAAVTRRRADGWPEGGWYPQERLTQPQALRGYTLGAAYAAGLEHVAGSLAPGKWADWVVLTEDVLGGDPARILKARVVQTVVGGEVVYAETQ